MRHVVPERQNSKPELLAVPELCKSQPTCRLSFECCACVCALHLLHPMPQGLEAMAIARAAHVKMAFGSDLLGAMHK
jgi:hypothetical protein